MATKKLEPENAEANAPVKEEDEHRVMVMVPYVEGEDPDVTVIVNGYITKFRKGEMVAVRPEVAHVLANNSHAAKEARRNREKYKMQVTDL